MVWMDCTIRILFDIITLFRSHAMVDKVIMPWSANKHMLIAYKLFPVITKQDGICYITYEKLRTVNR